MTQDLTRNPWLAFLDKASREHARHKAAIEATSARLDRVQAILDARAQPGDAVEVG